MDSTIMMEGKPKLPSKSLGMCVAAENPRLYRQDKPYLNES